MSFAFTKVTFLSFCRTALFVRWCPRVSTIPAYVALLVLLLIYPSVRLFLALELAP